MHHSPTPYIRAHLDLTGMRLGETLYFNLDNARGPFPRDYSRFIQIDKHNVIDEVLIRTDPLVELVDGLTVDPVFWIGGAPDLQSSVAVPWAAPAGYGPIPPPYFSGKYLTVDELNAQPVNLFGHTAAVFPYGVDNTGTPDNRDHLRYLAVTAALPPSAPEDTFVFRGRRRSLPVVPPKVVATGTLAVTLKLFPKRA
jgi:hypothetical protein